MRVAPTPGSCRHESIRVINASSPIETRTSIQAHHLKRGAAKRAVGIVQRLADLKMIVVLGNDEPHGLAGGLERGGEFPGLALEFRRFQSAVQQSYRASDAFEMTLAAERIFRSISEV